MVPNHCSPGPIERSLSLALRTGRAWIDFLLGMGRPEELVLVAPRGTGRLLLGLVMTSMIVATLVGLSLGTMAIADQVGQRDPKEFPTVLNISFISHGHGHPRDKQVAWLQQRIRMYKAWRSKRLRRYGDLSLTFPSRDRSIEVFYHRGLRARMTKDSGRIVGRPKVWRPDRRTVAVSFPHRWLGANVQHYNWRAVAVFAPPCEDVVDPACPAVIDVAPNEGNLRHFWSDPRTFWVGYAAAATDPR